MEVPCFSETTEEVLTNNTTSHTGRLGSSATALREPQISQSKAVVGAVAVTTDWDDIRGPTV
jgi:hypothetical protein